MGTRNAGWWAPILLTILGGGLVAPPVVETIETTSGRPTTGRIVGDAASGFRFQADGGDAVPLDRAGMVRVEGSPPESPRGAATHQVWLGLDQRISGRLREVTDRELVLEVGEAGTEVRLARSSVRVLTQRPGEALVWEDSFEALGPPTWTAGGSAGPANRPVLTGRSAGKVGPQPGSLTHRLAEPIGAGRLEVAFHDSGETSPNRRWFVELIFQGQSAEASAPIRAILGWSEPTYAVQCPDGPALAVQRLTRGSGWRRFTAEFGPRRTELAIDGQELAHGAGPLGPLKEVRIVAETFGPTKNDPPPAAATAVVDDLRLVKFAEPSAAVEFDTDQDSIRLTSGDQLFGSLVRADATSLTLATAGRSLVMRWDEVAGVIFRRSPTPGVPLEGLFVRVEWLAGPVLNIRDLDRVEGVLQAADERSLTVATAFAGTLQVPRERLRSLTVLGQGWCWVLDATPRHLGNDWRPSFEPPAPDGASYELAFDLPEVPNPPPQLVFDVVEVVGEAKGLTLSNLVRDLGLRANVIVNGETIDYLNHHITSPNDAPERIQVTLPPGTLKPGKNTLKVEQTGTKDDPRNLDDWQLLRIALER
jgi:hypothetical protein